MGDLLERYNKIVRTLSSINANIEKTKQSIAGITDSEATTTAARIEKLEAQLKKIDDYVLRIDAFRTLAEKHLESKNILTIEAPPGYRVNLNRLRQWSMLIDPTSSNDPYAQRVYAVALCDKLFLEQKRQEFTERVEALKSHDDGSAEFMLKQLNEDLIRYRAELDQLSKSEEVSDFLSRVVVCNERYWYRVSPLTYQPKQEDVKSISPGAYLAKLDFGEEASARLKKKLADYYDQAGRRVLLPVEFDMDESFVLTISCVPTKDKSLDKGLQNFMLSLIDNSGPGENKLYVLDSVRYSASGVGSLRQLEGSFALAHIPRSPEQVTELLEEIVSTFADIDEKLGETDSVAEYNRNVVAPAQKIQKTTLIVYGWPKSFDNRGRELLLRIMTNYERYGVSIIIVKYQRKEKQEYSEPDMPEYATHNAVNISMQPNSTTICFSDSTPQGFTWYSFNGSLFCEYAETLKKQDVEESSLGNEYNKRYSLADIPPYVRDYKKIELPFGIDSKDEAHSLSFENENFATYLVGASRSGKSTLLHTLIAGLIRNYHPDNVELWLADFKQLEFKRYINHRPPHVKYVLLDESTELVFDLVDKLTNEMMERQKLFARLGVQRIDQVDTTSLEKPLPVIFVILDEFSIMSQSIADSPIYKLRLQNILAKGAALGIKFLFSSQTFTTGVAGLSATARAQIQQRIAMKGSREEISETLELSSNLKTEQVRNWMDALPPHYALVKFRIGADTLPQVKRYLVMYFKDYEPRDRMIKQISDSMIVTEQYNPADIRTYVDKHPVLVDGNTFDAFETNDFVAYTNEIKKSNANDLSGDEMFISFGTPRLMVKMKPAAISAETRENILLIARAAEQNCAASIVLSALKSYQAQHGEVEIWAYGKNRLYKTYKQIFLDNGIKLVEGIDDVCDAIKAIKQSIINKESSNKMIALIGMDRICIDFDYVDGGSAAATSSTQSSILDVRKGFEERGAMVENDDEEAKRQYALKWIKYRKPYMAQAQSEGKSKQEIKDMLQKLELQFRDEEGYTSSGQETKKTPEKDVENIQHVEPEKEAKQGGAYNAKEDFVYVIKQGSRLGYHFLLDLNSFADLKQCGLKLEFFRYKLSFQVSVEDSRALFTNKIASALPEHICQFDDTLEKYSFRPYLHKGISWEGWYINEDGEVVSPYEDSNN